MARFLYKARNNAGQLIEGDLIGESEADALNQLRQMGHTPVKITQDSVSKNKKDDPFSKFLKLDIGSSRIKARDLILFCTNISSMTSAGIPLLNTLDLTGDLLTNAKLADACRKISQLVSDGSSFSDALAVYPKIFSNFFVNMIRTGEMSGALDKVLREMVIYLEKEDNLRQTIKGMLIYPMVLLIACSGVVILVITFLMPQFVAIFTKAGVPLPLPTMLLYQAGIWVKKYPLFYIPTIIGLIFGFRAIIKTPKGKILFDQVSLKLPIFGELINSSLVARFCRTLAAMLDTGVPMLMGLKILKQILENAVFVGIVGEVYASVEKGEGIHSALMPRKEFPKDVTYMISVGERSGNIGMMLNKIADFYENKIQFKVKELLVLIEPLFISIMGVVVGVIMASIILPMFDMIKTIKQ